MSRCDAIADAVVMGEPLSDADRDHVEDCAACQRLTSLPAMLAASTRAEPPRPGFSARMMVAARERIGQRHRRRVATFTLALAAAAAGAVVVDRHVVRDGARAIQDVAGMPSLSQPIEPETRHELESLFSYRDALAPTVDWEAIEAPVVPFRHVLRQGGLK